MRRYSLYAVLFGALALAGLVLIGALYFSINKQREGLIRAAVNEKIYLAETIEDTLFSPTWKFRVASIPGVEDLFISQMARFRDIIFIRILGDDGAVRRSNKKAEIGITIEDQDVKKAVLNNSLVIKDVSYNGELAKIVLYPAPDGNVIQIGFSLKGIKETLAKTTVQSFSIGFGSLAVAFLFLSFFFRSIINPIKKLTAACYQVAIGNLNVVVNVESKTEIGELASTFNKMIGDLKKYQSQLEGAKAVLEIKVRDRTKELRELAENLEEKVRERTKELWGKIEELERFYKMAVGRELKMIELKKKLAKLKKNGKD